jgi:hypothetical protein|tara:strand:- start:2359 stop:2712 length:354 start_codon:yes stop_codon:yes gene_type:complete
MQVLSTTGGTINFIAREDIVATKNYQLTLTSENKNKVILTDSTPTFGSNDYYSTYATSQNLVSDSFYNLEIKNTTDNTIIFKDKIFCTNQNASSYVITNNVYTEHNTGANEYLYYSG